MIKSTKNISKIQNLKKEYITGTIDKNGNSIFNSLDYLIKNHNMSPSTVYRYSSAENWKTKRKSFIDRTHKLYLSNTLVKNQMNEIITIILIKAKKMLEDKNLSSDDLFVLTETIKMCKENFKGLNDD